MFVSTKNYAVLEKAAIIHSKQLQVTTSGACLETSAVSIKGANWLCKAT